MQTLNSLRLGKKALVVGAGPAGLMAAEVLARGGATVTVVEKMPSVGRRLLMAGRGGLNLTHSEGSEPFLARYGQAADWLRPHLQRFGAQDLVAWAHGLGQETFVGSSGRVFPRAFKASPLLRAWLARLEDLGVVIHTQVEWLGFSDDGVVLDRGHGPEVWTSDVVVLALGGASWPKLGGGERWVEVLRSTGIAVAALRPANSGLDIAWSPIFRDAFAGQPLKSIALKAGDRQARGEAVVTRYGLEGGAVYAVTDLVRDTAAHDGQCTVTIDLRPQSEVQALAIRVGAPRSGQSLANRLRKAGLPPVAIGLMREGHGLALPSEATDLARAIKAVPLTATGVQGIARAISTAGGIRLEELDHALMLKARPGVFAAGEMLDWEAPTGGYLLQASFATGAAAGTGALAWLAGRDSSAT